MLDIQLSESPVRHSEKALLRVRWSAGAAIKTMKITLAWQLKTMNSSGSKLVEEAIYRNLPPEGSLEHCFNMPDGPYSFESPNMSLNWLIVGEAKELRESAYVCFRTIPCNADSPVCLKRIKRTEDRSFPAWLDKELI